MTPKKTNQNQAISTQFDMDNGFDFPSNGKINSSLIRHSISTQFNMLENKSVETDDFQY